MHRRLYAQTPLSREVTGKTFTDTEKNKNKKIEKYYPFSDWDCHTGNPVNNNEILPIF